MACSGSRATDLQYLKDWYYAAYSYNESLETERLAAQADYIAGNDHAALWHVIIALGKIYLTFAHLIGRLSPFSPEYAIIHFLQYHTVETASINMDSILNAMLAAKFTELEKFIGIEDAYRVALWNAPFNAAFYAALARGFIKWP